MLGTAYVGSGRLLLGDCGTSGRPFWVDCAAIRERLLGSIAATHNRCCGLVSIERHRFANDVGIDAVAGGDTRYGRTRLRAFLNDLGLKGIG